MRVIKTIGMFNYGLNGGGIERVVVSLAGLWQAAGYRVVVITEQPVCQNDEFVLPQDIEWARLPKGAQQREDAWKGLIARFSVDILVHHQYASKSLSQDVEVLAACGVKTVVVVHDAFAAERYGVATWNNSLYDGKYPPVKALACLSPVETLWWGYLFQRPAFYVPNPLACEFAQPAAAAPPDTKDILWIGRFTGGKRLPDALHAFAMIAARHPAARLVILGSSSTHSVERQFRQLARKLGIADRVIFAGKQKDVAGYFKRAAIHLVTSVNESFALTIAESKAHGVPVVMYELPYLSLVEGGKGILSVKLCDRAALAEALHRLLSDDAYRKRLGAEGRESLQAFSNDVVMQEWRRVFEAVESEAKDSDIEKFQTRENYEKIMQEMARSWNYFMSENAWKLKVADWLERRFPLGRLKKYLKVRRPDLFSILHGNVNKE